MSELPVQKYLPQAQREGKGTFFAGEGMCLAGFGTPGGRAGGFEMGGGASSVVTGKAFQNCDHNWSPWNRDSANTLPCDVLALSPLRQAGEA